jgi:hypothetical protein
MMRPSRRGRGRAAACLRVYLDFFYKVRLIRIEGPIEYDFRPTALSVAVCKASPSGP